MTESTRIRPALEQSGHIDLPLAELFQQAPGFMALLLGREHRISLANPGYLRLVGDRDVLGMTVAEVLGDAVEQGYLTLLDNVFETGRPFSADASLYAVQTQAGGPINNRYVDFVFQPIRSSSGDVIGILVQGTDITERYHRDRLREGLVRLSDRFRSCSSIGDFSFAAGEVLGITLEASRVGFGTIDPVADTLEVERDWTAVGVDTLEGVTPLRAYGDFIDSLKAGEFISIGDTALDPRTSGAVDALASRATRSFLNVPVIENDRLVAVLFVNSDRTRTWALDEIEFTTEVAERTRTAVERARSQAALADSEKHLRLMVMELNHRVKNNLAIVTSIAMQTLKGDRSPAEAQDAFVNRIQALAISHDILTDEQRDGLDLREVATGVLAALQGALRGIEMKGPTVYLSSKAGLSLAMAFHELGTNALKYGSLSVPNGRVSLTWSIDPADPEQVTIHWIETGGPGVVPPARRGFGSRLLERALASEINGRVEIDYDPVGVRCTINGRMVDAAPVINMPLN